jgi:putative endonuclease
VAKRAAKYFVYILECEDGSYYTGIATDVVRRFEEHKRGAGAKYTRSRGVTRVVFCEKKRNKSAALKREAEIKSMARPEKEKLVQAK